MKTVRLLVEKDLLLEFRRPQNLIFLISLNILLSVLAAVAIKSGIFSAETEMRLYAPLLWLIFIFTGCLTLGLSLDKELSEKALDNLKLFAVPFEKIFIAKAFVNFILIFPALLFTALILQVLLNTSAFAWLSFILIAALAALAYSFLTTLLAGISAVSRLKAFLLPLIAIPLIFPLFFASLELSLELILNQRLDFSSVWFSLLIVLNVIYFTAGVNLYKFALSE